MAKAPGVIPIHGGGRTLSRMVRKKGSGHSPGGKKAVWYQQDGKVYGEQAKLGSYLHGDPLKKIPTR